MARLGIVAANMSGLSFAELQGLAREAESAGFEAIFSPEFMNDALANCQLMAQATTKIKVGTWIANIYLRHPALCAQTAVAIDDTSKGRLILGLGVSHRPLVEGIYKEKMDRPREFLREYITTVRDITTGKGYPGAPMQPRAATHKVPIYVGALALGTVELCGELADGAMLYLCPKTRIPRAVAAVEKGAAKAGRPASAVDITTGLPTCISDDLNAARATAKNNLAFYGNLPFYNKLFQNSGFTQETAALARGQTEWVSDRMAEEVSLVGPPSRCREQLAAFREAGIQFPIIVPVPIPGQQTYAQAVRKALETFA
ncbi:MAG TPA: LLM class flavin-dependent oxidoreductase [Candidatus Binatia bacterium]|nr:LLM class flavin-dependent oxidoreductase [Candidatus Binatia bacterium]